MALDLGELVGYIKLDDSQWDATVDKMPSKFQGKAALFGAAGLAIGGVVIAAMAKGMNDAIAFDDTLAKISGTLGLTEVESARVGALAGKVYADNFGESVEQVQSTVAGVITQIEGMGDASDSTVDRMTAHVLTYANAFGVDTADAIAMVQQLMTSGLATSADEALDLMTTSMQRVPEALRGDLADAVTEYGPLLAQMGFTGKEAFDLLASGADRGMYGIDKAGDALKEFGINATDMSTSSKSAYDALGMSQEDMTNRLLAGGDTAKAAFDEIVGGLQGIKDPAKQSQAALALFGTPLEDLGVAQIPEFLGSLDDLGSGMADAAGSTDALSKKVGGSVASQMEAMSRQVENMMRELMSGLLPVLTAVFGFMAENPAVIQIVAAALGVLALAFVGVSVATWAMNTALLANPITWIILGIVALIAALVLLIANWDSVVKWISDVWGGFMGWLGDVMDGFVEWWSGVWAGIAAFFTDVWNGIVGFVKVLWETSFIGWLVNTLVYLISNWDAIWSAIAQTFEDIWNGIISWATSVISGFINGWKSLWGSLTSFFSGLWSGISKGISNAWNGILSFFGDLPKTILGFFSGVGKWLWDAGRDLIQGLFNGIQSLAGTIGKWFLSILPDWIREPFKLALGIHSPSTVFEGYGKNTVQGYLNGIDAMQPTLDRRMGDLVDTADLDATINAQGQPQALVSQPAAAPVTVIYNAAENRALSAEEDLFAAMGSARVVLGKGTL